MKTIDGGEQNMTTGFENSAVRRLSHLVAGTPRVILHTIPYVSLVLRPSLVTGRSSFVILLLAALTWRPALAAEFPAFAYHRIDAIGNQLGQTALADIDRDGDLDWIVGESASQGGAIWWWEYQAADRWIRHPLGVGHTDVGGSLYDVNSDGWLDMFSGSRILINSRATTRKGLPGIRDWRRPVTRFCLC